MIIYFVISFIFFYCGIPVVYFIIFFVIIIYSVYLFMPLYFSKALLWFSYKFNASL